MTALLSLLWAAVRTPIGAGLLALVIGYAYGGAKWYVRGVENERAAALAATARINARIDALSAELARTRALKEAARNAALAAAVDSLSPESACLVSPELAEKLNAIR